MPDKLKILHLEDTSSDAELVKRELTKGNIHFTLLLVDNRLAYINAIKDFNPDIIISDHSLPSFDSIEALKIYKELDLKIPFILVTATISEEFAVNVMKYGAWDYILKDRLKRLPAAVLNALDKFRVENERQQFLDETIASEALFKEVESFVHFGTFKADMVTGKTIWSQETFRILGYTTDEVKPSLDNFFNRVFDEDLAYVKSCFQQSSVTQVPLIINFRVKTAAGLTLKYVRAQFMIERDGAGNPLKVTGFYQDVSETKLAEEQLYKSEANLRTIFNNTETGFTLIDADMRVISFNKPATLFAREHLNREVEVGPFQIDAFPPNRQAFIRDVMTRAIEGETIRYEANYIQEDGQDKWYDVRWGGVRKNEQKLGIILSITDITQRKNDEIDRNKITSDLMHRNKDLEQFTYIVSHNLRAPVANIIGLSNLLNEPTLEENEKHKYIDALLVSAKNLDGIIRDLNSILQIKSELNEKIQIVYFSRLVNEIKSGMQQLFQKGNVTIECDFSQAPAIDSLHTYLYSIFYNLIMNSIKYCKPEVDPVICLKSSLNNNLVEIIFKDNGRGIDLVRNSNKIFGLYKRFDTSVEGKGLGLFIVKTQVEMLDGKISVESEINKGTTFTIQLPFKHTVNTKTLENSW